ncbi:MAG: hypothetical protein RL138_1852 [Bacteroidota bacterium]|jgi:hypothetical protein|nr:lytic transglycosylase domain-containing protein [Chitinophagales bacterium]
MLSKRSIWLFLTGAIVLAGLVSYTVSYFYVKAQAPKTIIKQVSSKESYLLPNLPSKLDFAGEAVPLEKPDVHERLLREMLINTNLHAGNTWILLQTSRWFPLIVPILKEEGVPEDFKYLCVAESGLQQVVSKSDAVGFWQFLEETGKQSGLEISKQVDERYHVEKSTRAACRYFKRAYAKFGSWTLVAAAFNCGEAGVEKFMNQQQVKSYYDALLPDETMRYVFRILAFKNIISQPKQYHFSVKEKDYFSPRNTYTDTIRATVKDLAVYAKSKGCTYKELKIFNPWLREKDLVVKKGKEYIVLLPKL